MVSAALLHLFDIFDRTHQILTIFMLTAPKELRHVCKYFENICIMLISSDNQSKCAKDQKVLRHKMVSFFRSMIKVRRKLSANREFYFKLHT